MTTLQHAKHPRQSVNAGNLTYGVDGIVELAIRKQEHNREVRSEKIRRTKEAKKHLGIRRFSWEA